VRKCAPYPTSCYLQSNELEQGMILSSREVALNKFTDVYRFTSADLVEIGGGTVKVATLPAGGIITNVALFVVKDLESGSVVIQFGDGTSANYINQTSLSSVKCRYSDGAGFTQGEDAGTLNGIVNNTTDDIDVNMTISLMNDPVGGEFLFCANILDPAKIAI